MKTFKELSVCDKCKTSKWGTMSPLTLLIDLSHLGKGKQRMQNIKHYICNSCKDTWDITENTYDKLNAEIKQ